MSDRRWFWGRMAERYARMPVIDAPSYERKLARTRALLTPESRVLEFGCGTGSTAIAHAPHVAQIVAIDSADEMLGIARARAAEADVHNVRFEHTTLAAFDSPDATWDVVMGMSILHLLADRAGALARVHALLKPGGVFISSTICVGDASWKLRLLAPVIRVLPVLPDIHALTLSQLSAEMVAAGFELEDTWCPGRNKAAFVVARKPGRVEV